MAEEVLEYIDDSEEDIEKLEEQGYIIEDVVEDDPVELPDVAPSVVGNSNKEALRFGFKSMDRETPKNYQPKLKIIKAVDQRK